MPLLKETPQEAVVEAKPVPPQPEVITFEGVPYDVYSFFSTSLEMSSPREKDKLRDIYEFARGTSHGETLQNISNIETKLGLGGGEKRVDRVWNWVRLNKYIKDLEARKGAMEKRV